MHPSLASFCFSPCPSSHLSTPLLPPHPSPYPPPPPPPPPVSFFLYTLDTHLPFSPLHPPSQSSHPLLICLSLSFSPPSICLEVLLRDNSTRGAVKDREDVRAARPAREKSFEIASESSLLFSSLLFSSLLFSSLPSSSHPSYLVDKSELCEYAKYAASWACFQNHVMPVPRPGCQTMLVGCAMLHFQ